MYEKIKHFFQRYWPWLFAVVGLCLSIILGFRHCARSIDIVVKNCKTTINEISNKHK